MSRGRRRELRLQMSNNKVPEPTSDAIAKHLASSFVRAERAHIDGNIISFCKATAICTGIHARKAFLPQRSSKGYTMIPTQHLPQIPRQARKNNTTHATAQCRNSEHLQESYVLHLSLLPWSQELFGRFFFPTPFLISFLVNSKERLMGLTKHSIHKQRNC